MEKPIKGCDIPFINLSKENLKLICDMLEGEEMLILFNSIYDYIYNGIEPTLTSKVLNSVWNNVMSVIERKSESYFGRKKHIDEINKRKKETSSGTSIQEAKQEKEFSKASNQSKFLKKNKSGETMGEYLERIKLA